MAVLTVLIAALIVRLSTTPFHAVDLVLSVPAGRVPVMDELSDTEQAILAIERLQWKYAGLKEARVREDMDLSMTSYYAALNRMLSDPRVEAVDPLTVRRLRRVRDRRVSAGVGRSLTR